MLHTENTESLGVVGYTTPRAFTILQVFTFYDSYLAEFYEKRPKLKTAPYAQQLGALYRDGFGAFHVFTPTLREFGHNAEFVIANCEHIQKQWAKEYGVSYREESWQHDILRAQINALSPDIFYTLNPLDFDTNFLNTLEKKIPLVVGWRAAEIPQGTNWNAFDVVLSHLTVCRKKALEIGARYEHFFHPGVPEFITDCVSDQKPEFDVVFSGQWTPHHGKRNETIVKLCEAADREGFTLGLYLSSHHFELPAIVQKYNRGARWGMEMYKALRSGRIVVNAEIDLAMGEAGNLRLYEATAVGACLLTENHKNLSFYLKPDVEVLSFGTPDEMLSKIRYYLKNPELREEVARRGLLKMKTRWSMYEAAKELDGLFQEYFKRINEPEQDALPSMTSIIELVNSGREREALIAITEVLKRDGASAELLYAQAVALAKIGAVRAAKETAIQYVQMSPDSQAGKILLEQMGIEMPADGGIPMTDEQQANTLLDHALTALRDSTASSALEFVERARSLNVAVRDLEYVRAMCLTELDKMTEAKSALESELRNFPDNTDARDLLKRVEEEMNKNTGIDEPAPVGTSASATDEELNKWAQDAVGFLQSGRAVDAMRLADKLAAAVPHAQGVHYLRVLCLNAVGRHEEAFKAAEQELMQNPGHAGARSEYERLTIALTKKKITPLTPEQRSYSSALDNTVLNNIQNATHNYSYRGVPMIKNPFDFALYPLLLWNYKPKTIIEIGSKNGGSALWFGDLMDNFGLDGHIYSLDIVKVADVGHKRVTFMEANGRELEKTLTPEFINSLPRPLLVIEDADHSYETSSAVLKFFHPFVKGDEYIVIEDGIISDLERDQNCNSGPHRALKEFIAAHPGEYDMDQEYSDYFGYNYTWCTNGFLKKRKYAVNPSIPKSAVTEFLTDDPAGRGLESQMSINERFQLHYLLRSAVKPTSTGIGFIEIGSHAGASLKLEHTALKRFGVRVGGVAVEPGGAESFYKVINELSPEVQHVKAFSHDGAPVAIDILRRMGLQADFILVDGDHTYEGVRQDILDYYPLVAPGGIIAFHDFLPALTPENQAAIFFHHGGKEPGIRQACLELMEGEYKAEVITLPLLYPDDPTQTQPHLPVIPGVFSTIRAYRKKLS